MSQSKPAVFRFHYLSQGFPTLGSDSDTLADLKGCICCSSNKSTFRHKTRVYVYSPENLKIILRLSGFFVLLSLFVIRNVRGTRSSVEMLKGYTVRKRLGTLFQIMCPRFFTNCLQLRHWK